MDRYKQGLDAWRLRILWGPELNQAAFPAYYPVDKQGIDKAVSIYNRVIDEIQNTKGARI